MYDFLSAVILGIVQGVTEFLPISSTGHLILVNQFFDFSDHSFSKMFDVVIQLGSILAVVIYFWEKLWPFGARKPLDMKVQVWQTWFKALVGIIPALVIGALFGGRIQELLYCAPVVAGALIFWGIILVILERWQGGIPVRKLWMWPFGMIILIEFILVIMLCGAMLSGRQASTAELTSLVSISIITVFGAYFLCMGIFYFEGRRKEKMPVDTLSKVSYLTAFKIGLIQCFAMVPGTSRSAVTIIGGMLLGSTRVIAAEFSFFLAIPTMVAASGYSLFKYGGMMTAHQFAVLAVGFIVSFFVAWGVIAGLMKFIQRHNFIPFGIYRIILGAAVLGYFYLIK